MKKLVSILFTIILVSCSKYDGDTQFGKEMKIDEKGIYDFDCNYGNNVYFYIDKETLICVNLPDSLNTRVATAYKYIIDYRVLSSKQSCSGDVGSFEMRKIELYSCRRK
jgi:hypothetical protein